MRRAESQPAGIIEGADEVGSGVAGVDVVGAALAEVHDDWQPASRRYLSEGSMRRINQPLPEEVTTAQTPELPAA